MGGLLNCPLGYESNVRCQLSRKHVHLVFLHGYHVVRCELLSRVDSLLDEFLESEGATGDGHDGTNIVFVCFRDLPIVGGDEEAFFRVDNEG